MVTKTGTDCFAAGALPFARSCEADTRAVGSARPSRDTSDPEVKPTPFTVSVKLPVGTGDGLTDEMAGSGMIVIAALPVDVGDAVLVARKVKSQDSERRSAPDTGRCHRQYRRPCLRRQSHSRSR